MNNKYGLNDGYFKREFNTLMLKCADMTPKEMERYLEVLADIASSQNIQHENKKDGDGFFQPRLIDGLKND